MEPAKSEYAMYARSVQSCVFKTLSDVLRDVLVDAVFQFTSDGIKLVELDNTHIVMLHLRLDAKHFEEFHCEEPVNVGVNMANFHMLLKTVNTSDSLTLFLEKTDGDRNWLGVRIENEEKHTATEFKLNLLDLDVNEYNIPRVGFSSSIILPSQKIQKILRDMSNISEKVEIKNIGRELILSCEGHFCKQETVLQDTEESDADQDEDTTIKQGVFSLRHLVMFTKCSPLCPNVEIYLKNTFPLVVRYQLSLGELKLCLSPIVDNDSVY